MPKSDRWKRVLGRTGSPVLPYTSIPLYRIGQPLYGDPSASQVPILIQLRWFISSAYLGLNIFTQPKSERPLKPTPAFMIWTPTQTCTPQQIYMPPAHMSTDQTLDTSAFQYNTRATCMYTSIIRRTISTSIINRTIFTSIINRRIFTKQPNLYTLAYQTHSHWSNIIPRCCINLQTRLIFEI
jgi:hypothetical protein